MASYYYLISSLPMLRPNEEPPFDYPTFLGMCRSAVSGKVYEELSALTVYSDKGPLLSEWARFYKMLTAHLNYQRNVKLGRAGVRPESGDAGVAEAVAAALSAENPLKSEQLLLKLEFERLDSMIGLHNFDEHALFGYAMKLKLLERQQCFRHEKGSAAFRGLLDGIQQQIFSIAI